MSFNRRVKHFPSGRQIYGRDLSDLSRAINDKSGIGAPREIDGSGLLAEAPIRVVITSIAGDVLVCQDPDIGQLPELRASYLAAKPPLLRRSLLEHNEVTFVHSDDQTRVASKEGETDETQVILPAYVVGDTLFIIDAIDSGVRDYPTPGATVPYVDLNVDGRMWAVQVE